MRETEYVDLAFWAGWLEALGYAMSPAELESMRVALVPQVCSMIHDYVASVTEEVEDA